MKRARLLGLGFAFLFVGAAQSFVQAQSDESYYRLAINDLACILENINAYRAQAGEPVFIDTTDCPPEDGVSLLGVLRNEAPEIPLAEDVVDRFLALTHEQLECLSKAQLPKSGQVVRFFPETCAFVPEAESK